MDNSNVLVYSQDCASSTNSRVYPSSAEEAPSQWATVLCAPHALEDTSTLSSQDLPIHVNGVIQHVTLTTISVPCPKAHSARMGTVACSLLGLLDGACRGCHSYLSTPYWTGGAPGH